MRFSRNSLKFLTVYDITGIFAVIGQKWQFEENDRKNERLLLRYKFKTIFKWYWLFLIVKKTCWRNFELRKIKFQEFLVEEMHLTCIQGISHFGMVIMDLMKSGIFCVKKFSCNSLLVLMTLHHFHSLG